MESWFQLCLVFATSLLYAASFPRFLWSSGDSEFIWKAVTIYNDEHSSGFLFKLLPGGAHDKQNDPQSSNLVTFRVKETVCQKSPSPDLAGCEFKEDGEIKTCSAIIDRSANRVIDVTCDAVTGVSEHSDDYLENDEVKKTERAHRKLKRRSISPLKKRASNESIAGSLDSSSHAASCLQCIFGFFGTKSA